MSTVLTFLIVVCTLEALAFAALFSLTGWRHTPMGRHLMAFGVTMFALLCLRMWARLVAPPPDAVWAIGFTALAAVLAWRLDLLWRARRGGS